MFIITKKLKFAKDTFFNNRSNFIWPLNLCTVETHLNDCIDSCNGNTSCIYSCVSTFDNEKERCPCGKKCPLGCPCEDCDDCFQCDENKCVNLGENQDLKEVCRHLQDIFYLIKN